MRGGSKEQAHRAGSLVVNENKITIWLSTVGVAFCVSDAITYHKVSHLRRFTPKIVLRAATKLPARWALNASKAYSLFYPLLRIVAIHQGASRLRDIQRSVNGITTKVLSKELKYLEQNKLVVCRVFDTSPPTVEYTTSSYCNTLQKMILEMIDWGKNHRKKIREK